MATLFDSFMGKAAGAASTFLGGGSEGGSMMAKSDLYTDKKKKGRAWAFGEGGSGGLGGFDDLTRVEGSAIQSELETLGEGGGGLLTGILGAIPGPTGAAFGPGPEGRFGRTRNKLLFDNPEQGGLLGGFGGLF